jgi:hypothetical protein
MEAIDTIPGAIHDEESGLVVQSEVVPLGIVARPWVESAIEKGGVAERQEIGGLAGTIVKRARAACQEVTITVVLRAERGSIWNVAALCCSQVEFDRARALVNAMATRELLNFVAARRAGITGVIRGAEAATLRVGMNWNEVRQFGPPLKVEPAREGGLLLEFIDDRPGHEGGLFHMVLSRDRSLLSWEPK